MCYLYILEDSNENKKIGISGNPKSRLASIQTGNANTVREVLVIPFQSRVIAKAIESHFHVVFKKECVRGEWFTASMLDIMLEIRRLGYFDKITTSIEPA